MACLCRRRRSGIRLDIKWSVLHGDCSISFAKCIYYHSVETTRLQLQLFGLSHHIKVCLESVQLVRHLFRIQGIVYLSILDDQRHVGFVASQCTLSSNIKHIHNSMELYSYPRQSRWSFKLIVLQLIPRPCIRSTNLCHIQLVFPHY